MTLKNRGRSKKTVGRTRPRNKGGTLAVGTYLQRGSAPPPPRVLDLPAPNPVLIVLFLYRLGRFHHIGSKMGFLLFKVKILGYDLEYVD